MGEFTKSDFGDSQVRIVEVSTRGEVLVNALLDLWERCVRETHLFLSNDEILAIKNDALGAIKNIPHLLVLENKNANPLAFMGIAERTIEMLFVANRRQGFGKKLIEYAMAHFRANEVAVNEQNPNAVAFYKHFGFEVYKRSDLDSQGRAYPLLYMKLNSQIRGQNEKMV